MYIMQSKVDNLEEYLTSSYNKSKMGKITSKNDDPIRVDLSKFPGICTQFAALFIRTFKLTIRNPSTTFIRLVQVLAMAFIYCSIYF